MLATEREMNGSLVALGEDLPWSFYSPYSLLWDLVNLGFGILFDLTASSARTMKGALYLIFIPSLLGSLSLSAGPTRIFRCHSSLHLSRLLMTTLTQPSSPCSRPLLSPFFILHISSSAAAASFISNFFAASDKPATGPL